MTETNREKYLLRLILIPVIDLVIVIFNLQTADLKSSLCNGHLLHFPLLLASRLTCGHLL